MNLCKCGCEELVQQNYKRGHGRRGKTNSDYHNAMISLHNTGRKMSEETKKKMSESMKGRIISDELRQRLSKIAKEKGFGKWMTGKKHSQETIQKIIKLHTGIPCLESAKIKIGEANNGEKNGMFGKKHSKHIKQKISESAKKMWLNEETRNRLLTYPERTMNCRRGALKASELLLFKRFSNTQPEQEFKKIMDSIGIKYIHPFSVWDIEHCYSADFFIPETKTIIEIDGKFFHDYPNGIEIDKIRTQEMIAKGYSVLRFWENEFNEDMVAKSLNLQTIMTMN